MRYPGGKGKCYQHLINLMPPHETYIEPFLGGGAVMRHKRPAYRNIGIDIDERALAAWRHLEGSGVELIQDDAIRFFKRYEFRGGELVYADPPYLPQTRRQAKIYRYEYTFDDHVELLKTLSSLPCRVMVSGYENPLYSEVLKGWRRVTFQAKTHVDVREESVWMNFEEPNELHDTRYLGKSFRERQQIQRRQMTLRRRIHSMSPIERSEFLRWLNKTFSEPSKEESCSALA